MEAEVISVRRLIGVLLSLLIGGSAVASEVTVTFLGHSCFTIQELGGPIVMIDPYGRYVPYPALPRPADIVLITHFHIDHCPYCYGENDRVEGDPIVVYGLDESGRCREKIPPATWLITETFQTSAIEASHVTANGGGQGYVCMFSFEVGGIRFAHLGDLGTTLSSAQRSALSNVDVLFIPVGGAYTLNAAEAMTVVAQLPSVRVAIPMHYYVDGFTPWSAMQPVSTFTALAGLMYPVEEIDGSSVVLDSNDLTDATEVWVLDYER